MKKVILLIAVIATTSLTTFAFTAQANCNKMVNTEVTDEYVPVEFKDLPVETQELLFRMFDGYVIKAIFVNNETKLLKVVVLKDDEEKTFVQNDEGKFIEQE